MAFNEELELRRRLLSKSSEISTALRGLRRSLRQVADLRRQLGDEAAAAALEAELAALDAPGEPEA